MQQLDEESEHTVTPLIVVSMLNPQPQPHPEARMRCSIGFWFSLGGTLGLVERTTPTMGQLLNLHLSPLCYICSMFIWGGIVLNVL